MTDHVYHGLLRKVCKTLLMNRLGGYTGTVFYKTKPSYPKLACMKNPISQNTLVKPDMNQSLIKKSLAARLVKALPGFKQP